MTSLLIAPPLPIAAVSVTRGGGGSNLLTPDPKEVWLDSDAGGFVNLDLDLGANVPVDTIYLGSTNAAPDATWSVSGGASSYTTSVLTPETTLAVPTSNVRRPRHAFLYLPAPVSMRFVRITVRQPAGQPPMFAGVALVSKAFRPTWGHEYGSGRTVIDTGTKQRLLSGGFGTSRGARKGSWSWTMGDLTDDEVQALYNVALDVGETGPVLVVEDPDRTAGLSERLHYGLFDKIDTYERIAPGCTKWALSVEEWV